jgi:NitT/TauT family transport system substrate-binding protein
MTGKDWEKQLLADVLDGHTTRRRLLKRAALLGLSAPVVASLLAACGDDDDTDDAAPVGEPDDDEEEDVAVDDTEDDAEEPEDTDDQDEDDELRELRPFTFILDFLPYGEYGPYFYALQAGIYEEEGLDVEILRGEGSGNTIQRIARGHGHAGSADFSALTGARANENIGVKAIFAYFRRPPHSIFVLDDSDIESAEDLEGARLSITPGNSHQILFPLLADLAGFDADSVSWVSMDGASMGPALIQRQVDGAPFFANHERRLQMQAEDQGLGVRRISYADYGLDMYSLVIVARDEALEDEDQIDLLRRFLRGTARGMNYVFRDGHCDEGAQAVVDLNPEVDLEASVGACDVASEFSYAEEVLNGEVRVGEFESDRVVRSRDISTEYLELDREVPEDELYTNDLIPDDVE